MLIIEKCWTNKIYKHLKYQYNISVSLLMIRWNNFIPIFRTWNCLKGWFNLKEMQFVCHLERTHLKIWNMLNKQILEPFNITVITVSLFMISRNNLIRFFQDLENGDSSRMTLSHSLGRINEESPRRRKSGLAAISYENLWTKSKIKSVMKIFEQSLKSYQFQKLWIKS